MPMQIMVHNKTFQKRQTLNLFLNLSAKVKATGEKAFFSRRS